MFYSTTENSSSDRAPAGRSQTLNSSIARSCSSGDSGSVCGSSHAHALSHAQAAPANSSIGGGYQSTNSSTMSYGAPEELWYCHVGMAGAAHYAGPWLRANTEQCLTCNHTMCNYCTVTVQNGRY